MKIQKVLALAWVGLLIVLGLMFIDFTATWVVLQAFGVVLLIVFGAVGSVFMTIWTVIEIWKWILP